MLFSREINNCLVLVLTFCSVMLLTYNIDVKNHPEIMCKWRIVFCLNSA